MMRCGFKARNSQITKLRSYKVTKLQNSQRGYMLLTLMLVLALMTIALLAALPSIKQEIRRDREEEMIHRGTAYMRAIQRFYKKFGRYPGYTAARDGLANLSVDCGFKPTNRPLRGSFPHAFSKAWGNLSYDERRFLLFAGTVHAGPRLASSSR